MINRRMLSTCLIAVLCFSSISPLGHGPDSQAAMVSAGEDLAEGSEETDSTEMTDPSDPTESSFETTPPAALESTGQTASAETRETTEEVDSTLWDSELSDEILLDSEESPENELQEMIDRATASNATIVLEPNTVYTGSIVIDHGEEPLVIVGGGGKGRSTLDSSSVIDGDVTVYNQDVELKDLTITGSITAKAALSIINCEIMGGVVIEDNDKKILIQGNRLHYTTDTPALKVVASDNGSLNSQNYVIGRGKDTNGGDPEYKTEPNTFINGGAKEAIAISWPVSEGENASARSASKEEDKRLIANRNFWEFGDRNALFHEVKVHGDVKYASEMTIKFRDTFQTINIIPPDGFVYRKGKGNSNLKSIQDGDIALLLYGRSPNTNGTAAPVFTKYELTSLHDAMVPKVLPYTYQLQGLSAVYSDGNFATPYKDIHKETWGDDSFYYMSLYNFMTALDIAPKNMVSYAGAAETLSSNFPRVWYDYNAINPFFEAEGIYEKYPHTDQKYFSLNDRFITDTVNGTEKDVSVLTAYLDTGTYKGLYKPWEAGADLSLDPDGDYMPFIPGFHRNNQNVPAKSNQAGTYIIQVDNHKDISKFSYDALDRDRLWPRDTLLRAFSPGMFNYTFFASFYPNFLTADLIVRPVSKNLTVEKVSDHLPSAPSKPVVRIADDAAYQDSTGQVITTELVSLLNDNEEPVTNAYQTMLETAKKHDGTKDRNYEYHFLSLLNTSDGNNVITTPAEKTVFIPYPHDYKAGDAISLMHFADYQRMPTDKVDPSKASVIQGKQITKLETGFTFTTTDNMGSYLIAYGSMPPPEESTTQAPEETSATQAPEETSTQAPTTQAPEETSTQAPTTQAPEETSTHAPTTQAPEETSTQAPTKPTSGSGDSGGGTSPANPTAPTTPVVPTDPTAAIPTVPTEPTSQVAPSKPTVFPDVSDLPDTPGFIHTPESGGDVVKGPDDVFYFISDQGVPLAYYVPETDSWNPLEGGIPDFLRIPKTGDRNTIPWMLLLSASSVATVFLVVQRRRRRM